MDLDSLAKLGEFVGGIFVVVTLAYLAHQVRQNTKTLRTENYARVLDRMSTVQSRLSVDADLNRVLVTGAEDPGKLTWPDRIRFSWLLYELFGAAEFMYHQSREKSLPPAVWERWEVTIGWWLSHPGMRAWWAAKPAPFARDFEEFGSDILRNHRMDPGVLERWRGFVSREGLSTSPAEAVAEPR